jgi:S1-C subfamily serine protease
MKNLRPLFIAVLLAAGFYYYTTRPSLRSLSPQSWLHGPAKLELTEAAQGSSALEADEQINIAVYRKVLPSVVNVTSTTLAFNFFYGLLPEKGQGTGFVIDHEGHILTNYHVVENARQVEVTLYNRKKYKAEFIGADKGHDLAVIKIDAPNLTPAVLGDSRGLSVGQFVFAIGNPFGLNGTMTRGIVSSIRSVETPEGAFIDDAIQTDAAINPGNSGGPLLNSRGEVIGINAMIATGGSSQSAGVGFAIPINTAKAVLNDLVSLGTVRRPSMLIRSGLPIGPELASELGLPSDYGVLIMQVTPGGSADRAGLRGGNQRAVWGNNTILIGGDLIVAIDGQQIEDLQDISRVMNNHRAGDTITVTVFREKKQMDFKVVLGEARPQA